MLLGLLAACGSRQETEIARTYEALLTDFSAGNCATALPLFERIEDAGTQSPRYDNLVHLDIYCTHLTEGPIAIQNGDILIALDGYRVAWSRAGDHINKDRDGPSVDWRALQAQAAEQLNATLTHLDDAAIATTSQCNDPLFTTTLSRLERDGFLTQEREQDIIWVCATDPNVRLQYRESLLASLVPTFVDTPRHVEAIRLHSDVLFELAQTYAAETEQFDPAVPDPDPSGFQEWVETFDPVPGETQPRPLQQAVLALSYLNRLIETYPDSPYLEEAVALRTEVRDRANDMRRYYYGPPADE